MPERPAPLDPPRDTARQQKLVTVERIVTLVMFIANAQAETDRIAAMLLRPVEFLDHYLWSG